MCRSALASALEQACRSLDLSSVHVTFCSEPEWQELGEAGWLQRVGMQFHWENAGYATFDDFLGALSSRKRKVLRRERRDANAAGLTFRALNGADIKEAHWDAFYRFYRSTVDRKWGSAYLSRSFFSLLGERLGDRVVLMMALQGEKRVRARGHRRQRGAVRRRLGLRGDWPFLHFELCYYRAIDWAIDAADCNASRRARRGATRSSAGICQRPRTRRIGSRIRPAQGDRQFPAR